VRLGVGRHFGLAFTPATGAAALVVGGLWMWSMRRAAEIQRNNYRMAGKDYRIDALYRKLDLRSLSNQQIRWLHEVVDQSGEEYYRDPLRGWTVTRWELQRELLRRSGGGGLLFVPPVVALPSAAAVGVLVQAGRGALVAGLGYLIAKVGLNWGSVNSRQRPFGPDVTVPLWWPTGAMSLTGNNWCTVEWTSTSASPPDCQTVVNSSQGTYTVGPGLSKIDVVAGPEALQASPCGGFRAPDQVMTIETGGGPAVELVRLTAHSDTVRALNFTSVVFAPKQASPSDVPYPAAPKPLPLVPRLVPSPVPVEVPQTVPLPEREVAPVVVPGTVPLAPPSNPNPARRPAAPPIARPGSRPQLPPGEVGESVGTDGKVQAPKPLPLPVTPPTTEIPWPGAPPIGQPGQQPRPDLVGIAQELGKIERKLAIMNTPTRPLPPGMENLSSMDWKRLLWDLLQGMFDAGEYRVWSPCLPQGEPGSATDPLVTSWGSSLTPIGGLENRLNALAQLIQDSKVLPQPTCRKPALGGEWVTVNFESDDPSPAGEKRLRKIFRYLDQNFSPLEDHVQHWAGFSWESGPWCVIHKGGVWGVPQVWAATVDEGKRVIRHAASIAGVDVDAPGSQWVTSQSSAGRQGMPGVMRVRRGRKGAWLISKRIGSNGLPEYLVPADRSPAP
jgi:hypothetical protein